MKVREFIKRVMVPDGCVLVRKDGDHHVYRLPNGRVLGVPVGGSQNELSSGMLGKYRRLLKENLPERRK